MAQTLNIRGIKFSTELVLVRMPPGIDPHPSEIIRRLAAKRINLTCVVLDSVRECLSGIFCIDAEDLPRMERVLEAVTGGLEKVTSVGTLTIFPHRCRLDLLAAVLRAFAGRGIPLIAVASSMSALTVALPYRRLDEAVEEMSSVVRLPANHAPFRPQFRIRQV
jgi:hypothetical protein